MSAQLLCNRINTFGARLLEAEYALDINMHTVDRVSATVERLMWVRSERGASLIRSETDQIDEYLGILRDRDFSYVLVDGSVIQVAYTFDQGTVQKHRLLYYPCPFDINADRDSISEFGLLDFFEEVYSQELRQKVRLRSPFRFDYDPGACADYYPSSHLSLISPSCRIPIRSPLSFDRFVRFVFENFYLDTWRRGAPFDDLVFREEANTLTDHDKQRIYIEWN